MKNRVRVFAWSLALSLAGAQAFAQSQATTGQVTGRVVDSNGGALPGVTINLASADTGFNRTAITGGEGLYTAPLLPPGTYDLTASLSGFQNIQRSGIPVTVGSNVTVDVTLGVAGVAETVNVEASTPQVETTSSVRSSTLGSDAIENLPINGRRFQDFVTLTPTAQVDPSRGQISLAGQRGINANVSIDGADFNQPFFGGIRGGERSNTAFTVPQEAIREFQVVAAGYTAEFGRSTGGIVNAVTKSGTNNYRGSAFYLNRNRDLAEKNAFDQEAAPTQHQFGGSFGGPLKKDKAFFFLAYEQQKLTNTREVLFDRLVGLTPAATSREAFDFYKSLETPFEATNDAQTFLGRVDFYQFSADNRLSVRYSHSTNEALNANATGNALDPNTISALSNNGTERNQTDVLVGQYTSVLTPQLLLEVRGQYSRESRPRDANAQQPTVENAIGRFGTVSFLGQNQQYDWRGQGAANLTWIKGRHTAKLGAEYNHVYVNQDFGFNQHGRFLFSTTTTTTLLDILSVGGAIANRFDDSSVTYLRQLGNLQLDFATNEMALFAQDHFRLTPHLTVNYGLRWEGQWNPTPETNNAALVSRVRGFQFPIGRSTDPTIIPDQLDQWGPRVGFAWDPTKDGRTVVRGFGGIYYARTPALLLAGPMNNFRLPPGDLSVQLPFRVPAGNPNTTVYDQFLLIGIDLNQTPLGALPELTPEQVQAIARALGLSVDPFFGAQPISLDNDYKNPRSYQGGLGFERQIADGLTVGVEGTIVKTDRLQRNREVNLPVPVIRATDPAQRPFYGLTTGTARPQPALGSVQIRESTARSLYRALTFSSKLQRKWGQANVYYVLSKSESDDDNERDSGGVNYDDSFNLDPEYGPARLDRTHYFNGSVIVNLPWDFDVSSGFRFLSGRPIDATLGLDANGDRNTFVDRPYSAPGVPFTRNDFRNRSIKLVNLRVQKSFRVGDERRLTLSAEAFNLFNSDNIELNPASTAITNYCASPAPLDCGFGPATNPNFLQVIDQNPTSTTRGQVLRTNLPGDPRQIQLGLRLAF